MSTLVAVAAADTTTTTGTGAVTLSGTAQAITINGVPATTFNTAFTLGGTIAFPISNIGYQISDGTNTETGLGTLTNATTLTRDTVLASSNGGRHVNFIAGTKTVVSATTAWNSTAPTWTSVPAQTLPENDIQSGTFVGVLTDGVGTTNMTIRFKVSGSGQVTLQLPAATVNNTGTSLSITGVPASLCGISQAVPCMVVGTAAGGVTVPGIATIAPGAGVQSTGTITFQQYTAGAFPAVYTATFTASVVRGTIAETLTYDIF